MFLTTISSVGLYFDLISFVGHEGKKVEVDPGEGVVNIYCLMRGGLCNMGR